jgi:hypothetical protein
MAAAKKAAAKTAPAKVAKPKVEKDSKNGVTRPKSGSTVGKIWDIADKLAKGGKDVKRADVLTQTKAAGINDATAATQFGKWRRYNGIKGRIAAE